MTTGEPIAVGQQQEPSISDDQQQRKYNHPPQDLLVETKTYIDTCIPLHIATITGDWEAVNRILSERKEVVRFSITENLETALHIAVSIQNIKFVKKLLEIMNDEDLELQNKQGNTALCIAAAAGNRKLAEILVKKNKKLLTISAHMDMMPLYMAALFRHHDTVNYLYDNSQKMAVEDGWTDETRGWVLKRCIEADIFDVALKILDDCPKLALNYEDVLEALARNPKAYDDIESHFSWRAIKSFFRVNVNQKKRQRESKAMQLHRKIWKKLTEMPSADVHDLLKGKEGAYTTRVLFIAAEMGNSKFVVELIRECPDLMWAVNDNDQTIFHIAVSHRHESIYSLLHEIGSMKDLITAQRDKQKNNMLHLVGMEAKNNGLHDVSGDALKMQREMLWFKEVERMVPFSYREKKNNDDKKPHELFTKNHEDLASKGEKWLKKTATQCMVVATLIATIVFGVAFTIPGGYDQKNGYPMFIQKRIYIAFVISDAISLIFSVTAILMFLFLLTSRYEQEDFLKSIPQKLMIGLATLFLSIMTMMVAFSLSFFVLYHSNLIWVPIVISIVASIPVILYYKLHRSLLMDVYHSLYGYKKIFKPKHRLLYQNPKF